MKKTTVKIKNNQIGTSPFSQKERKNIIMHRKKTHEEFVIDVFNLVGNEFEIIGQYKTTKTKIEIKHVTCNRHFQKNPYDFLRSGKCPLCSGNMKKTQEQFVKEIFELVGNEFSVISQYKNSKTKVQLKHQNCGEIISITPNDFFRGNRCRKCGIKNRTEKQTKTHNQFLEEVFHLVGNEYEVMSEYVNTETKVEIKHTKCGTIHLTTPHSFLSGTRCKKCFIEKMAKKYTKLHEQFVSEVAMKVGSEYDLLSHYEKSNKKVQMRHNTCGEIISINPNEFLRGQGCKKCGRKRAAEKNTKSHETFIEEVNQLFLGEYEVLGEYKNNRTKIKMKHTVCGYEFDVLPSNILFGSRCYNCASNSNKGHEQFGKEVFALVGNEFEIVGKYVNSTTPIEMKHTKCNRIINVSPSYFLHKSQQCKLCLLDQRSISHEEFVDKIYKIVKDEYEVLSKYKNTFTKVTLRHTICNNLIDVNPGDFLNGSRCIKCSGKAKKTQEEFLAEVYKLVGNEYEVISEYKNALTKIDMKHNTCGYLFSIVPNSFLNGTRCIKCFASKGEKAINKWLDENRIKYIKEYRFDDCKYKKPLPFDFAIFIENHLLLLIEYQGIQHYEVYFRYKYDKEKGERILKGVQKRDQIKRDYCQANNIRLLEIPYWEFKNIDQILIKEFLTKS